MSLSTKTIEKPSVAISGRSNHKMTGLLDEFIPDESHTSIMFSVEQLLKEKLSPAMTYHQGSRPHIVLRFHVVVMVKG